MVVLRKRAGADNRGDELRGFARRGMSLNYLLRSLLLVLAPRATAFRGAHNKNPAEAGFLLSSMMNDHAMPFFLRRRIA